MFAAGADVCARLSKVSGLGRIVTAVYALRHGPVNLSLTRGPAGNWATTGSVSASRETPYHWAMRTTVSGSGRFVHMAFESTTACKCSGCLITQGEISSQHLGHVEQNFSSPSGFTPQKPLIVSSYTSTTCNQHCYSRYHPRRTWGRGWMTKASGVGERRKGRRIFSVSREMSVAFPLQTLWCHGEISRCAFSRSHERGCLSKSLCSPPCFCCWAAAACFSGHQWDEDESEDADPLPAGNLPLGKARGGPGGDRTWCRWWRWWWGWWWWWW